VDAAEVAFALQILAHAEVELMDDLVGIAFELLGTVFCQLGDGRLSRIPVARAVLIEIGSGTGQPPQGVAKNGG